MTRFDVEASSADGRRRERLSIEAPTAADAARQALALGRFPIHVHPERAGWVARLNQSLWSGSNLGLAGLALFAQQLSDLLRAGVTLEQGLALLAGEGPGLRAGPTGDRDREERSDRAMAALAMRLLRRVREGTAFSIALREEAGVPRVFAGVVQGAEGAGQLAAGLASVAASLQRQSQTRERIVAALAYPLVVLAVAVLALLFVLTVVIPEFAPLFNGEERRLPLLTRGVLLLSSWVTGQAAWIAVALLLPGLSAWAAWRRSPAARRWAWRVAGGLAPVRYALRLDLAQATRTLGTLLESGTEASTAMQLAAGAAGFARHAQAFGDAARALREGAALAKAYAAVPGVPRAAATLLAVGEQSGEAGAAALRAAHLIETETTRRIDRLLATLNPVAVIALGALVALLIAAIMLGILSINQLALR